MSTDYQRFENETVPVEDDQPSESPPSYEKTYDGCDQASAPLHTEQQSYPVQTLPAAQFGGYPDQHSVQGPLVYQQSPAQQIITHAGAVPMPPDYFGFALFVTLCCCLPLGIVALIRANEARSRIAMGDIAGAHQSAADARRYSWMGLIFGILVLIATGVFVGVYISVYASSCNDGYC